jgi:hypothetical protein
MSFTTNTRYENTILYFVDIYKRVVYKIDKFSLLSSIPEQMYATNLDLSNRNIKKIHSGDILMPILSVLMLTNNVGIDITAL